MNGFSPTVNRLAREKSPYLLQHAHNPVDWYPWGEEAFASARRADKPIFLSIGYSTCYWCHVMEREVFENERLAALMNEILVCIKVDREERPDVDRIYMSAVQAMTGSGGWPMSVFLDHDLRPFYGATYIPPVASNGRPGFGEIVERIREVWKTRRTELVEAGERVISHISRSIPGPEDSSTLDPTILAGGASAFERSFDDVNGGFGGAPKFPRPVALDFLLRMWSRTGDDTDLRIVLRTLQSMTRGGIFDHIEGGFHRYATDARWHVPHFEKMLYDQALLIPILLDAYVIAGRENLRDAAERTIRYVLERMRSPDGAFYSAEDAESSEVHHGVKKEGAFYTWRYDEVSGALDARDVPLFCAAYDIQKQGNIVEDPHGVFVGTNILHRIRTDDELSAMFGHSVREIRDDLRRCALVLLDRRSNRPRPHRDDKVISSWNGMMIAALARASRILDDPVYARQAEECADTILRELYTPSDDKLYRRFRDGDRSVEGLLEDYAWLACGLLELYQSTFDIARLRAAIALTDQAMKKFYDAERGGFFDTDGKDRTLIVRTKEWYDGAEPSGNSVMAMLLLRLGEITGNTRYLESAEQSLTAFADMARRAPEAVPSLLSAFDQHRSTRLHIVISGPAGDPVVAEWRRIIGRAFLPEAVIVHIPQDTPVPEVIGAAGYLRSVARERMGVYICEDNACRLPVHTTDDLHSALASVGRSAPSSDVT